MAMKGPASPQQADATPPPAESDPDPATAGPSAEEVDAWAERERARRQAWLAGPTEDERAAWADDERARRRAEKRVQARAAELARLGRHYGREGQLATEGAISILLGWSRKTFDDLVRAGRQWEDETSRAPRRVPLDDEPD
jgi:hypothetical protein